MKRFFFLQEKKMWFFFSLLVRDSAGKIKRRRLVAFFSLLSWR